MTAFADGTVLVEPPGPERPIDLLPGQSVVFGREVPSPPGGLRIPDPSVSRLAGEIRATADHWLLSNFSRTVTYVVENPEGGGEFIKVQPARLHAPVPFEFSRIVIPAARGFTGIKVYAPRHEYAEVGIPVLGELTRRVFALDETAKYFTVLVALCEPRLRDEPAVSVPTASQVAERLRPLPGNAELTRSAVNFHIDYLAEAKLRLRPNKGMASPPRDWKRQALAATALRFNLVREEHLRLLPSARAGRKGHGRA
jgi:hypothetical protein